MLWIIYNCYFKESVKIYSYVKFLKWYVWLTFSLSLVVTTAFYFASLYFNKDWLQFVMFISGVLGGFYFGNEIKKVVVSQVGSHEDIFDNDIITLRYILINKMVHSENQINALLEQLVEELPELKTSERLIKPIYTFGTILITPILMLIIKWIIDKHTDGLEVTLQILTLILMIFGLFFMLKPILEQLLDSSYWKMKKMKQMLNDIKIIDFLR